MGSFLPEMEKTGTQKWDLSDSAVWTDGLEKSRFIPKTALFIPCVTFLSFSLHRGDPAIP